VLLIHRIVKIALARNHRILHTKGDFALRFDPAGVGESEIIGRVAVLKRGPHNIDLQSPLARSYGFVVAILSRLVGLTLGRLRTCSRDSR
jgi:hypothetical protein